MKVNHGNFGTCKEPGCTKPRFEGGYCIDHSGAAHDHRFVGGDGVDEQRNRGVKLQDEDWEDPDA
jgi:hypothetical protein